MDKALITINEAEEVVQPNTGLAAWRTPLMVVTGVVIVIAAVLIIMILLSLRGARTGLGAVLPFLEKNQVQTLQLPK